MPSQSKKTKASKPIGTESEKSKSKSKSKSKTSKSKSQKQKTPDSVPVPLPSESESEEDDGEDEGVDAEGMERLMKLLGDDGLDEFEQAQLAALNGEDEDESEDEEAGSVGGEEDEEQDSGLEGNIVENDSEENEEEDEEDAEASEGEIALDEADSVDEDAVPRQKIEIDNKVALDRIRESIQLDPSLPWTETLALTYTHTIDVDVNDDLNRELAFYKQALHCANEARSLAEKHKLPFTRPSDYFAEMVKNDAHMERIRQRLLDESAGIKKGEEKRKEREGKKFGKQVQIEKLKERERSKKEMEERLQGLKRKRGDILDNQGNDDFDVAVENAIADRPAKRGKGENGKSRMSRTARDSKFGFGGATRRSKQNTRESTDSFVSGPGRGKGRGGRGGGPGGRRGGARGKPNRPGKSRRMGGRK